jgi:hypothetical protein
MADQVQSTDNKSLTIAADAVSIYEGGNLITVNIGDLLNNEVAVRQVINDYNQTKRESQQLERDLAQMKAERTGYALQPAILGIIALFNVGAVFLVGLGTNYLSSSPPVRGAGWILAAGIAFTALTSIVPPLLPVIIAKYAKRK